MPLACFILLSVMTLWYRLNRCNPNVFPGIPSPIPSPTSYFTPIRSQADFISHLGTDLNVIPVSLDCHHDAPHYWKWP